MNYLILSEGEYSDYRATWYAGEEFCGQEDFDAAGRRIGDELTAWFFSLPEGVETYKWGEHKFRKQEDGEQITQYELAKLWTKKMIEWLTKLGYSEIKANGEINIAYSEIPVSKP